jgi:hypothetical protein
MNPVQVPGNGGKSGNLLGIPRVTEIVKKFGLEILPPPGV